VREAVTGNTDTLFTMEVAGEPQVYHLSQRRFHLNAQPQQLLLLKQLTRELAAHARFAKLPRPRPAAVDWSQFMARLQGAMTFRLEGKLPSRAGSFDASQLEQVMINLLKNAAELGSRPEDITVSVRDHAEQFVIEVADRGTGLAENVLRDALLPFYSTKETGTGLGLTLCREIVEAHGGRLSLANRQDGPNGAVVTLWLPSAGQRL
jgi:two-component system, NtrC family, nitrogen regulation sensor histidine kinase NtrY